MIINKSRHLILFYLASILMTQDQIEFEKKQFSSFLICIGIIKFNYIITNRIFPPIYLQLQYKGTLTYALSFKQVFQQNIPKLNFKNFMAENVWNHLEKFLNLQLIGRHWSNKTNCQYQIIKIQYDIIKISCIVLYYYFRKFDYNQFKTIQFIVFSVH